jgi:amidase
MGSRLAAGIVTPHDTFLMERFRNSGLVTLGRTNLPEFGWNITTEPVKSGATRNPWNTNLMAGGSSGGAAAAVAAGIVPMAHANDGAGSIRVPAACCGLVGLKPTRGRVTAGPDVGEPIFGYGCEFVVTRTVRDAAQMLDAVSRPGSGDPYVIASPSQDYATCIIAKPRKLRIAFMTKSWSADPVDAAVKTGVLNAVRSCEGLGHSVEEASPELDYELWYQAAVKAIYPAAIAYWISEVARMMGRNIGPEFLEACTLRTFEYGRGLSAGDLMAGLAKANEICRRIAPFFDKYDVLITPTNALVPQPLGTYNSNDSGLDFDGWQRKMFEFSPFTPLFNMTGQPALTLPLHRTEADVPVGVQFAGRFGDEATLLQLARQLEEAHPWPRLAPGL